MLPNVDPTATILPSGWRTVAAASPEPNPKSVVCLPSPENVGSRSPGAACAGAATAAASRRSTPASEPRVATRHPVRVRAACGLSTLTPLPHLQDFQVNLPPEHGAVNVIQAGMPPSALRTSGRTPVQPPAPLLMGTRAVLVPVSAHIRADRRTSTHIRCARRRPSAPGALPLHTREVAGSKPAAPIQKTPAVRLVSDA